jgi:hypothetical protein
MAAIFLFGEKILNSKHLPAVGRRNSKQARMFKIPVSQTENNLPFFVIPAKAGIYIFDIVLDSRLCRDFNGVIYCTYQLVVTTVSDCFF